MRGNKIWSIALLLSLALSMFAVIVRPAPAPNPAYLSAPSIVNPLMAPGTSFTIDILVNNVVDMWSFDFVLNYDPSVIVAKNFLPNPTDPVAAHGFEVTTYSDIDNTLGTMHVGANRGKSGNIVGEFVGIGDGVTTVFFLQNIRILSKATTTIFLNGVPAPSASWALTTSSGRVAFATAPAAGVRITANYNHPGLTSDANFPICSITFDIVGRGYSPLDLQDVMVEDIYFNPIDVQVTSGEFDNRFQGHLAAPLYKDLALKAGDEFDLAITAEKVSVSTWGIQFFLDYDKNILEATGATVGDAGGIVSYYLYPTAGVPEGSIYVQFQHANPGEGLVTEDPVSIAIVHFKLLKTGWTTLHIRDIAAVSTGGVALFFDSSDGSFASVDVVQPAGTRTRVETRVFYQSLEEDVFETMFIPVQTAPGAYGMPVMFKVVFTIYDIGTGTLITTLESPTLTLPEKSHVFVYAYYDTTLVAAPYKALVNTEIQYDSDGDGILDALGGPIGSISFTVLP